MRRKSYKVTELARLAKITVRTLHHYDDIGLLAPSERSGAGYRLYSPDDLLRLQQILILRELGMPLQEIRRMLDDPGFDRKKALVRQREELVKRAEEIRAMIRSVEAALATMEGGEEVDPKEIFEGFDPREHEEEVRLRWGGTRVFEESLRRTRGYGPEDWKRIRQEDRALMARLAEKLGQGAAPEAEDVMELAEAHRLHIDRWYYPCSHAIHARLASLYTMDPRFSETLEGHGEGFAGFLASAIRANAARR